MDQDDRRLLQLNDNVERLINRIQELIEIMGRNTNALTDVNKKRDR